MPQETCIDRIEVFALSCTVEGGPKSTLAPMPVRNGMLVRITTKGGAFGWGEGWCNYPPKGHLAKLNLMEDPIGPTVLGRDIAYWRGLRPTIEHEMRRMIIHIGEPGPFKHCMAALDMAAADLSARAAGQSLSQMLSADAGNTAQVYASSPNVDEAETLSTRLAEMGHTGVKIKVGFDQARDIAVLSRFRANDRFGLYLGIDANQNWTLPEAMATIDALSEWELGFVEEPILATAPTTDWIDLSDKLDVPLAAGENIYSEAGFAEHVDRATVGIIQPDLAKWGGVSGAMAVGRHALNNGVTVSPHFMGTGLGLAASLHVLAALGGGGRVELDANTNPLRTDLGAIDLKPTNGHVPIPAGPGIGFEPDPDALRQFTIKYCDIH